MSSLSWESRSTRSAFPCHLLVVVTVMALYLGCLHSVPVHAQSTSSSSRIPSVLVAADTPCFIDQDSAGFVYVGACESDNVLKLSKATGQVAAEYNSSQLYNGGLMGLSLSGSSVYVLGNGNEYELTSSRSNRMMPLLGFSISNGSITANVTAATPVYRGYTDQGYLIVYSLSVRAFVMSHDGLTAYVTTSYFPSAGVSFLWSMSTQSSAGFVPVSTSFTPLYSQYYPSCIAIDSRGVVWVGFRAQIVQLSVSGYTATTVAVWNLTSATSALGLPHLIYAYSITFTPQNGGALIWDAANNVILRADSNGNILGWFNSTAGLNSGGSYVADFEFYSLLLDSTDNTTLWAANQFQGTVDKINATTGLLISSLPLSPSQMLYPTGLALLPNGQLIVSSPQSQRLPLFDSQSGSLMGFVNLSSTAVPIAVATDSAGFIYVADVARGAVTKLSMNGTVVQTFGTGLALNSATCLCVAANGNVLVLSNSNTVMRYSSDRTQLSSITISNSLAQGLAQLPNGNILVSDSTHEIVIVYNSAGGQLSSFRVPTTVDYYWSPAGIAVSNTSVYVADTYNSQVCVFTLNGGWLYNLNLSNPQFLLPTDLVFNSATGDLFVLDNQGTRIYVYRGIEAASGSAASSSSLPASSSAASSSSSLSLSSSSSSSSSSSPSPSSPSSSSPSIPGQPSIASSTAAPSSSAVSSSLSSSSSSSSLSSSLTSSSCCSSSVAAGPPSNASASSPRLSAAALAGVIVGAVAGGAVACFLLALLFLCLRRECKTPASGTSKEVAATGDVRREDEETREDSRYNSEDVELAEKAPRSDADI